MLSGRFLFAIGILLLAGSGVRAEGHGRAEHVVLIVWDGMRPDFVDDQYAPNLSALRRDGVFFADNHPVYPSSTNVNGAALATGDEPGRTGILGNMEFRGAINAHEPFDTSEAPDFAQVDRSLLARYIRVPTLPELLHQTGARTAIAGSKPVAQLFDRRRDRQSDVLKRSIVLYRGKGLPRSEAATLSKTLGPFPSRKGFPNEKQDTWTTRALTNVLWKNGVPRFSLLWLSEPDLSEHQAAPGSPTALAAIRSSDRNLERVIAALKAKNALTKTDILVVSDHGFSTIDLAVDVAKRLRDAGFDAVRAFRDQPPRGQILVVSLGGSVEFYVAGHDPETIGRLIGFLQRADFSGVIFSRQAYDGTFTLAQGRIETPDAPDVLLACRWNGQSNEYGVPGEIASDLGHGAGQGTHASLSRFDMHNTLLASGPDFRRGWTDETPTGNIDVAPTIAFILGLTNPEKMDGRVLSEAFPDGNPAPAAKSQTLEARHGDWHQRLRLTTVGATDYLLEGNGRREGKSP